MFPRAVGRAYFAMVRTHPPCALEHSLLSAVEHGDIDDVRCLLSLADGPHPHGNPEMNGRTAIHVAAEWGRLDILKMLVETHGTCDFPRVDDGNRPIHLAAANGHLGVVELLVAHGDEADGLNYAGDTPADLARANGHDAIAEFLETTVATSA